jgi:hypothetical protein
MLPINSFWTEDFERDFLPKAKPRIHMHWITRVMQVLTLYNRTIDLLRLTAQISPTSVIIDPIHTTDLLHYNEYESIHLPLCKLPIFTFKTLKSFTWAET